MDKLGGGHTLRKFTVYCYPRLDVSRTPCSDEFISAASEIWPRLRSKYVMQLAAYWPNTEQRLGFKSEF